MPQNESDQCALNKKGKGKKGGNKIKGESGSVGM
jgi:hypothetical protein